MPYPEPYIEYLVHFHGDRDYFECHEILEEFWKREPLASRKRIWVAFIQIAVSLYHQRRENFNGAYRTMKKALSILIKEKPAIEELGLQYEELINILHKRINEIQIKQAYSSLYLPIKDAALLHLCIEKSKLKNMHWWSDSNLGNTDLIHRHKMRDRTNVISERAENLKRKKKNRQ